MAKKNKTVTDNVNDEPKEEFQEGLDENELEPDEELADDEVHDQIADLAEILANPDKAVGMKADDSEETEVVMYCPNCGVTGLFVDNVCTSCGQKKSKKSYSSSDESGDDMMDFGEEEAISMEEF